MNTNQTICVREGKYFFQYSPNKTIFCILAGPQSVFDINFKSKLIDDMIYLTNDAMYPNQLWCVRYVDVDFKS